MLPGAVSTGSGFIIEVKDDVAKIVTNAHVVVTGGLVEICCFYNVFGIGALVYSFLLFF